MILTGHYTWKLKKEKQGRQKVVGNINRWNIEDYEEKQGRGRKRKPGEMC